MRIPDIPPWAWKLAAGLAATAGGFALRAGVRFWRKRNAETDSDGDGDPGNDWQDDLADSVGEELPGNKKEE